MLVTGVLALLLVLVLIPRLTSANEKNSDVLTQVLGGTADYAANAAYTEADVYFHGGVPDNDREEHDGKCTDTSPKLSANANLPLMKLMWNLDQEITPTTHRHIHGAAEKEILPWFIAAVRLNPHLIDAWRTGTYWYYRTGFPKQAMDFANQAIKANPGVYQLYLERGILDHRLKLWDKTVKDMEEAQKLWKNNSSDAPYDKRAIKTYLKDAKSHEGK